MLVVRTQHGFSLMEVMIGVFLSTLLMSGIVQLLGGSVSVYRLQLSQGQLEESGRYANDVLATHITQAGYQPEPWQDQPELPAPVPRIRFIRRRFNVDGVRRASDRHGGI